MQQALLKSALGYKITEKRMDKDEKGKKHEVIVIREVPPSVTAQIFWLKNRRPDKWRDKPDMQGDAGDFSALEAINYGKGDDK